MWRSRWASSSPRGVLPGFVAANEKGPPATSHTHSVRMNFSPGSLSTWLVLHSSSSGFFDPCPTMGFWTTASLKWLTTAAIANTPPNRSYKLGSAMLVPSSSFDVPQRTATALEGLRAAPGGGFRLDEPGVDPLAARESDIPSPLQALAVLPTLRHKRSGVQAAGGPATACPGRPSCRERQLGLVRRRLPVGHHTAAADATSRNDAIPAKVLAT